MLRIKEIKVPGYEKVIEGTDEARGLHCIIAIHNTTLGPSLGGTRIFPYSSPELALNDVLRLSKAMTYKSAVAEDGLGGGKSVIIADPHKGKSAELLHAYAEVVDSLKGLYIAAEDVGSTIHDMTVIRQRTPYVAALPGDKSSGDPSYYTAHGVFKGILAVAKKLWNSRSLRKRKIAIQGIGSVGSKVAPLLFWEGAELIITDLSPAVTRQFHHDFGAKIVNQEEIYNVECDIFCPCAMGGILNNKTIPLLKCKGVAGSANNQLENEENAEQLMKRGILYAPDYIINSGGIINAAAEFEEGGYNPMVARDKVNHIYDILLDLFHKAGVEKKPTNIVANELAEHNLKHLIGKRNQPIQFTNQIENK